MEHYWYLIIVYTNGFRGLLKACYGTLEERNWDCDAVWSPLWINSKYFPGQSEHLSREISCCSAPDCSAFLKLWEIMRLEDPGFWGVCILMDNLLAQGVHKSNDWKKGKTILIESCSGKNYTKNEMLKMSGSRKLFFFFLNSAYVPCWAELMTLPTRDT